MNDLYTLEKAARIITNWMEKQDGVSDWVVELIRHKYCPVKTVTVRVFMSQSGGVYAKTDGGPDGPHHTLLKTFTVDVRPLGVHPDSVRDRKTP